MKRRNLTTLLIVALALALCAPAQQQAVQLSATTGLAPVLTASIAGSGGTTTAYYTLIAKFVGGSIASNIVTVTVVPNTLSSSNYVSFIWLPVAGVVTYDLLKLPSPALPSGSNSVALSAGISATTTSAFDQGGGLSSYTIAAQPLGVGGTIILNSRDHTVPQMEFDGIGSLLPGIAINGKALAVEPIRRVNTDATTTGVTIPAAGIINGVYLHAPTGAVSDTTDSAAAIVALLPNCQIGSASGASTGFTFSLVNNSAGAHAITILAGSGVALNSSISPLTLAQNTAQNFVGVVTNCKTPAVSLYSIGNAVVY